MKKLTLFFFALAMAVSSFATGVVGNDQPQSGVLAFTNSQTFGRITNTFGFQYTQRPVLVLSGSAGPYTINSVTTTNFDVSLASTNNTQLNFTAYLGYARIASGANTNTAAVAKVVTFPFTFAYPPVVTVTPDTTNVTSFTSVSAVTTTNFSLLGNDSHTNYWNAIGEAYYPGNQPVTY